MKKLLSVLFWWFLFGSAFAQEQAKIKIAIMGTFHFGESSDYISLSHPDLLTRKGQREIDHLVKKLAKFYPNKIFVENTPDTQSFWDNVYADFKNGKEPQSSEILNNEVFQIGIKLANEINDPFGVICVNYLQPEQSGGLKTSKSPLDTLYTLYSSMLQRQKPDLGQFFVQNPLVKQSLDNFVKDNKEWSKHSLEKHILELNSVESLNTLHYLNITSWMDQNPNGVGAELTSKEYFRNAKILQNILHKINPYDKHILIIIGAAHVKPLQDMISAHPLLEIVKIEDLLKK
ncbi:DUF5694 domain-containing protein [Lacihabitans sp. LS3-19]|uniref:DUF5694 domain-containing protein n=1 Tax=Lacihabitans sp. LS3-19 TaxID=2487335 RepID=UPI0020CFC55E|nr:DUF5694 domain-containing protein [Lacihabitans sp. LS3-19]